jgi:hypothetical protein
MRWRLFKQHSHGWSLTGIFSSAAQALRFRVENPQYADTTPIRIYSNKSMSRDVEEHIRKTRKSV